MNLGRRIVYDSVTGGIILNTGEDTTATAERAVWNGITYIDIPFGQDTDKYSGVLKYHVDIATKAVIFDQLGPVIITQDDKIKFLFQNLMGFNLILTNQNKQAILIQEIINALKTITMQGSGN